MKYCLKKVQALDLNFDPKTNWALNNLSFFPVEINKAKYNDLLRIPGIGGVSAKRIISARWVRAVNFEDLKKAWSCFKKSTVLHHM